MKEAILWKAAILLERIIQLHPFLDGNKRTAYEACKIFLEINDFTLNAADSEIISLVIDVAKGKADRHVIRWWLTNRVSKGESESI